MIKKQNANKQQVVDRFLPPPIRGLFRRERRYGIRSVYFRTGVKDVLASFVQVLSEGCDLLVIPAVPASLDTDGLVLMLQTLYDIGTDRYRVLLTKVPPPPEPEGTQLRAALTVQGVPLFAVDIPRLKAFEKAAAQGVPVSAVEDPRARRAWEAYQAAGKELVIHG